MAAQTDILWAANPGGQSLFLMAPHWEVLADGDRGGGKTDALLWDYLQHVGRGFGAAWRGILFRESYLQLADVIARSKRWISAAFQGAKYSGSPYPTWTFPDGEELLLRHFSTIRDYDNYHGHEYPWIGWEQLENWPTGECYQTMKSCSRSSMPDMPRKIRATANSYGPGHAWLKAYFVDPMRPLETCGEPGASRVRVPMYWQENRPFVEADPDYHTRLGTIQDEARKRAWLLQNDERWLLNIGGMFHDAWDDATHFIDPFPIPPRWHVDRSHDWGYSSPYCTLWFARSDGSPNSSGQVWPKNTLFVIAEDYGCEPVNEHGVLNYNVGRKWGETRIAQEVLTIEKGMRQTGFVQGGIHPGPGDDPLFDVSRGVSMAQKMAQVGVRWDRPSKGKGSRSTGWMRIEEYLGNAKQHPMEEPGLFVFASCVHLRRTLLNLMRDPKNPDDTNTDEDHAPDALRLRLLELAQPIKKKRMAA